MARLLANFSAALRLLFIGLALVVFFAVGTPLQMLIKRRLPRAAHRIPDIFCRSLLWLTKVRVSVEGRPLDARPLLLASNHVSWIDILALGTVAPFCFLAKRDVAGWPLVSAFAEVQGTVFVERRRRRSILPANRTLAARMGEGRLALLFPEGTTIAGPPPGRFLSAHFEAPRSLLAAATGPNAVMVQPVAISYSSPTAAWVGDDNLLRHVWETLRAPSLRCRIRFGSPLPFTADSDRKAIAGAARAAVVEMLDARSVEPSGTTSSRLADPRPIDCCASP